MIKMIADKVFFADDKTDKLDKNDILWWAKLMISKLISRTSISI